MAVKETARRICIDGMRGPHARLRAGAERLRPPLHLLHHPLGRGNSRSVPMGAVVEQVRSLVEHGSREVVLTGVDITSYGADLPGEPKLGTLVKSLLRHVPELERLRISSIDSVEADDDLFDAIASEAAPDAASAPLAAGGRRHGAEAHEAPASARTTRSRSAKKCGALRPDMVFGADIIAGFPTETEAMFARSLDIVEECGLTHLHVFPFSPRPGTPAARMPQVAARRGEGTRRGACGRRATRPAASSRRRGRRATPGARSSSNQLGRTEAFTPVRFSSPVERGRPREVTIAGHDGRHLLAA